MQNHLNLWGIGLFFISLFQTAPLEAVTLRDVTPSAPIVMPVDLQNAGDGSRELYIAEKMGRVLAMDPENPKSLKALLDIRGRVSTQGLEEGLLGLAFAPDYAKSGAFYVYYSAKNPRRSVISRFHRGDNKEKILLEIAQPYSNHNGGQIAFGPDGYLYIALGDGGSGGDPHGNGQSLKTLLGKILRIDVNQENGPQPYSIPRDNPFFKNTKGYKEEIYAYGLRNAWRFSFDPVSRELWTADVGQDRYEEIDIIEKGKNYGWNTMEGNHCFNPTKNCKVTGLVKPVWEYDHTWGQSVTGGYVYRGKKIPSLSGHYIFGDFVSGRIWSLERGKKAQLLLESKKNISSFGVDSTGELYLCDFSGRIYRFES